VRAIERGEIRAGLDPLVVANVCWMNVHGVTSMIVSGHAAVTAPGLEERLVAAVMDATAAWLRPHASRAAIVSKESRAAARRRSARKGAKP
jgi:hypothetical protein